MVTILIGAVVIMPLKNFREADGRKGAFADAIAQEMLAQTDGALCLVSDGVLDMNLLIQAHLQHRKLTLVPLSPHPSPSADIRSASKNTPAKRPIQQKESMGHFIERWLRSNPAKSDQVAVVSDPALWRRGGFDPIPHGLVYVGVANPQDINYKRLFSQHKLLWEKLTNIFNQDAGRSPATLKLHSELKRHASHLANDLGVRLEENGLTKEADSAYTQALSFDSDNVCALFNRYGLGLRSSDQESVSDSEKLIHDFSQKTDRRFLFESQLGVYGELKKQPSNVLTQCNASATDPLVIQWIAFCQNMEVPSSQTVQTARTDKGGDLAPIIQAIRAGDTTIAEQKARAFLNANPSNLSGWSIFADLLLNEGKTNDVATLVLPAMRKAAGEHGHELVDMTEGVFALKQKPPRYRDARTFFLRALTHRPDLAEAQEQLFQVDFYLNDMTLIETDASNILKLIPNHSLANALMGSVLLSQKRYDEAEKYLRKSILARPNASALNDLAELLRNKKKWRESEKMARSALQLTPNFYQAWDTLGSVLADQDRLNDAEKAFQCALSLCPKDPRIYINLARLNMRLNRPTEVRTLLARMEPMIVNAPLSVTKDFTALSKELNTRSSTGK